MNLAPINIKSGLSDKKQKNNTFLEAFKLNEFPKDKYIDLNKKLSTVY